jgi:hypothetical protein
MSTQRRIGTLGQKNLPFLLKTLLWDIVSKKLAEKAAWDFIEQKKPHFGISPLLPSFFIFASPLLSSPILVFSFCSPSLLSSHVLFLIHIFPLDYL